MRLIYTAHPEPIKVGAEVRVGDVTLTFRGDTVKVLEITKPKHSASTGRVYLESDDGSTSGEFYPGVINAEWRP